MAETPPPSLQKKAASSPSGSSLGGLLNIRWLLTRKGSTGGAAGGSSSGGGSGSSKRISGGNTSASAGVASSGSSSSSLSADPELSGRGMVQSNSNNSLQDVYATAPSTPVMRPEHATAEAASPQAVRELRSIERIGSSGSMTFDRDHFGTISPELAKKLLHSGNKAARPTSITDESFRTAVSDLQLRLDGFKKDTNDFLALTKEKLSEHINKTSPSKSSPTSSPQLQPSTQKGTPTRKWFNKMQEHKAIKVEEAISKLDKHVTELLSLKDAAFTTENVKKITYEIQILQQTWHNDWPFLQNIRQIIILMAQLMPLLEHLEMNPDDFRLILEVEEEEQSAVADSSNIDRDIYSVFWCAPFKFIESTELLEGADDDTEPIKDELLLCRICEEMLPENILESHTALCVKLSKCERLLVTSDEDLNKYKVLLKQMLAERLTVTQPDPKVRRERKILEEVAGAAETAIAYVSSQTVYEARTMMTVSNLMSSDTEIDPAIAEIIQNVRQTINQKLDAIRKGMQTSREQAELNKTVRDMSSLQDLVEDKEGGSTQSNARLPQRRLTKRAMRRSASIQKAFMRKETISNNLKSLLDKRPNPQDLVSRNIMPSISEGAQEAEEASATPIIQQPVPAPASALLRAIEKEKDRSSLSGIKTPTKEEREKQTQSPAWINRTKAPSIQDFTIAKVISRGAFGRVFLAKKRNTGDYFAIKVLRKKEMLLKHQVDHVKMEKDILASVNNPFVVKLFYSFESESNLYLVMEYLNGGDLYSLLRNFGSLEESWARFYTAELIHALDYLHSKNIVHRDLKPDNLLISSDGHIKLTDFGLSKTGLMNKTNMFYKVTLPSLKTATVLTVNSNGSSSSQAESSMKDRLSKAQASAATGDKKISGTPDYLAPETIMGGGYGASMDWWAVGVILFEMLVGYPPFNDEDLPTIFENILLRKIDWPEEVGEEARDLIEQLLDSNPKTRLGANGAAEVKSHKYFSFVKDWESLLASEAPFIPVVSNPEDTDYFTNDRLERTASLAVVESEMTTGTGVFTSAGQFGTVSAASQFGNFAYKSIEFLEGQNKDAIQKARTNPRPKKNKRPTLDLLRSRRASPGQSGSGAGADGSSGEGFKVVRCLIASGNPVVRRAMQGVFRKQGILSAVCADGREAVKMCQRGITREQPYDVIFLDVNLPVIAGVEAAKLIRADIFELSEDGAKETTILLFTPIQEERDAFVNGGGKDYTQGPLQRVSIDDLVLFAPQSTYGSRPESRNSGSRW